MCTVKRQSAEFRALYQQIQHFSSTLLADGQAGGDASASRWVEANHTGLVRAEHILAGAANRERNRGGCVSVDDAVVDRASDFRIRIATLYARCAA